MFVAERYELGTDYLPIRIPSSAVTVDQFLLLNLRQIDFSKIYPSKIFKKKTEMGRTCGAYGEEELCIQGFSGET
jgi:hypothetical protein